MRRKSFPAAGIIAVIALCIAGCGGGGGGYSDTIKYKFGDSGSSSTASSLKVAYTFLDFMGGDGEMYIYDFQDKTSTLIDEGGETYYMSYNAKAGKIVYDFGTYASALVIKTISVSGSGETTLYPTSNSNLCPRWSPDGSYVSFSSYNESTNRRFIKVMNSDGTEAMTMEGSSIWPFNSSWAPDSTKFVTEKTFMSAGGLAVYDVTKGTYSVVLESDVRTEYAEWSPDGSNIAFLSPGDDGWELMVADTTNYNAQIVCTACTNVGLFAWSPDGKKIAVINWEGSVDVTKYLYMVTVSSGSVSKVNLADYYDAGNYIVFDWSTSDTSKILLGVYRSDSYDPYGYAYAIYDTDDDTFTVISDYTSEMMAGDAIFID